MLLKELLKELEFENPNAEVRIQTGIKTSKKIVGIWSGKIDFEEDKIDAIVFR